MQSFIIHMRGDQKRQENATQLLAMLPNARITDAVRGKDVMATIRTDPGTQHSPRYPFPLAPGEVGCFLSHRQCWLRIVEGDYDYALIAEDDLCIDPTLWPEVMDLIHSHASSETYIRIPAKNREKPVAEVASRNTAKLFLPRVIGLQTVLQVVGRDAAKLLLAASETLDRPVDTFVQMHWVTGQQVHTILPNGICELTDKLGGSTIQKKTRVGNILTREIKRVWYRAQVNLRPQSF
jgi:GR25 family glycosyltransferase involved in LPS biosynthesis